VFQFVFKLQPSFCFFVSEKLLEALLKTEELDLEGKQFCLKAAENTLVPSVKELSKYLAYEEDLHLFSI
jgi:hypothetical protein